MATSRFRQAVGVLTLWMLAAPGLRPILNDSSTHRRHATCEHHLRHHHNDPDDRAMFRKQAPRSQRRAQERAQLEDARLAQLRTLENDPLAVEAVSTDTGADDQRMKRPRRRSSRVRDEALIKNPPQIRASGDFLEMLRLHLVSRGEFHHDLTVPLPHYGSGPCHAIPRPREGTPQAAPQFADAVA